MKTSDIEHNPFNRFSTLADLVLTERDPNETAMDRGFRLYRQAQLILRVAERDDVDPVDAEAWTGVARVDLARACWSFQDAANGPGLCSQIARARKAHHIAYELGRRLG